MEQKSWRNSEEGEEELEWMMCLGGYSGKVILVDIMILGHVHVLVMLTLWIFNLGTHLYHDQQRSATASLHSRP
jgi:hypothetical protein